MQKLAVKIFAVLMAILACISHAELLDISQNKDVSAVQYVGDHEIHLFYSDKTYCYIWAYHGFGIAGGKWRYQNPTTIKVKTHPAGNDYFGFWDYTEEPEYAQKILNYGFGAEKQSKLLLSFGNERPENMAWYDPKKDNIAQPIPQNASYVFLGNGDENSLGEYQLMRFALTPKPSEKGKFFTFKLAKDWEGMPKAMLEEFNPYYEVKNNQFIFHHAKNQTRLLNIPAKRMSLNASDEDSELARNAYDYCKTGHGMAHLKPEYKDAKYVKPTVIQWKGTPLNDNWQKAKNELF